MDGEMRRVLWTLALGFVTFVFMLLVIFVITHKRRW